MRTRLLFEHSYPNGNRIEVTNKGVTLWDDNRKGWVVDASLCAEESLMRIAKTDTGQWAPADEFPSLYAESKKISKKKKRKR